MKIGRLQELADLTTEGRQAAERGEDASRNRAFHLIGITSVLAVIAGILAVIFGAELTGVGLGDHQFGASRLKTIFGEWGPTMTAVIGIELFMAGLLTGVMAGFCLAGAIMEHLWLGRALRWALIPSAALLLGSALATLGLWRAGGMTGRLPWGATGWLIGIALPAVLFTATIVLTAPLFRREGD